MSRCWLFGDNIDTDALAPGLYIKAPIEELAMHCLESVHAEFAGSVARGDIVVAGRNFGMGSSREQAAQALLLLGVRGVVAQSFGGIFFRNAINLGLPVFTPSHSDLSDKLSSTLAADGDILDLDIDAAILHNRTTTTETRLKPLPGFLLDMIHAGGLVKILEKRFDIV